MRGALLTYPVSWVHYALSEPNKVFPKPDIAKGHVRPVSQGDTSISISRSPEHWLIEKLPLFCHQHGPPVSAVA
jgi:hypothetical protein